MDRPALIERNTKLMQNILPSTSKDASTVLRSALEDGLRELETISQTQVHHVSVQFWLHSGVWTRTSLEGVSVPSSPSLDPMTFYPSDLINQTKITDVSRQVRAGHLNVAVYQHLAPYLEAGHEASIHALAVLMLTEGARVAWLSLPMPANLIFLLNSFCGGQFDP